MLNFITAKAGVYTTNWLDLWVSKERDDIRALIINKVKYVVTEGYASQVPALRNGSYVYGFCFLSNRWTPIDIDIYYGDTQIPPNYRYVEWATGGKANCNPNRSSEPVYIIYKNLNTNLQEKMELSEIDQDDALRAFSICLKKAGAYRVCFYEPGNIEGAKEYTITASSVLNGENIQVYTSAGLPVIALQSIER